MDALATLDRPFAISEIADLGLTRRRLRSLVDAGDVRRVMRGIYAPSSLEDTQAVRAAALSLVAGPHDVVADLAAAWLYGVPCYDARDLDVLPPLHVVSVNGADRRRRPELLGGTRDLDADEIHRVGDLRITSPIRTACDVACLRGRGRAMAALDGFAREFGLRPSDFAAILPRYRGRRGCRQLRDLTPHVSPLAESPAESWTRLAIIDAGLPVPTPQHWVEVPGLGWVRLDLALPRLRLAVEYDGEEHHGTDQAAQDASRRAALARLGWRVIVVRKDDFTGPRLESWLADFRREIEERRTPAKRRYARGPIR